MKKLEGNKGDTSAGDVCEILNRIFKGTSEQNFEGVARTLILG